jgi:RNA polymerase sigma factor (sigma-70 family)
MFCLPPFGNSTDASADGHIFCRGIATKRKISARWHHLMLENIRNVVENVRSYLGEDHRSRALRVNGPGMLCKASFDELMQRVRDGDDAAETALFEQYVRRLIALAARQFDAILRDRADVELVVLSACKSFFLRNRRGEFELDDWGELWTVLAMITLRKCDDRRRYLRAARRDAGRDVAWPGESDGLSRLIDQASSPLEEAVLADTVESLLRAMSPDDRPIVRQILLGYTAREVGKQLNCSERTVRRVRQRAQRRLLRLTDCSEAKSLVPRD